MLSYYQENADRMLQLTLEHAEMVLTALLFSIIVAIVIIRIFLHQKKELAGLTYFFSLLYSIPSYAFFVFLIPVTGLSKTSAIIVLAIYGEYVLLRNFITGISQVDPTYLEIAGGSGMSESQIFTKVQLPLAMPAIFSGVRVALSSMMAIGTIASTISAGGLGDLLFEGLQTGRVAPLLWGTLLTVGLTLICLLVLKLLENIVIGDWPQYA